MTLDNKYTELLGKIPQVYAAGKAAGGGEGGGEDLDAVLTEQEALLAQLKDALDVKSLPIQETSRKITADGVYTILPSDGYALSKVVVDVDVMPNNTRNLYQRVEYIVSDENSYIITDFIADNSCGMEVVAAFPKLEDRVPMGSRLNSDSTRFYCSYPLSASSCYYGFNTGSSFSCSLSINTKYRLQTNFLNSRLAIVYDADGTRKGVSDISSTLAQQECPVAIFGYLMAGSNTVTSKRAYTLYSARLSQNNEVVREYIPCYRKSDGVIGLYEKYTDTFLENAGAGTFTKGADIDWDAEPSTAYNEGFADGREAEWNEFWDEFQQNGNRTNYVYAFGGSGWNDKLFKPKYDIIMSYNVTRMFDSTRITDLAGILEACGVAFDTSRVTDISYFCGYSSITHLPHIDITKATTVTAAFNRASALKTIDKLTVIDTITFTNTFNGCTALENITIEGTIGNSINFSGCPLTTDSMISIITHLKDFYNDTANQYTRTVSFSAACWDALAERDDESPLWQQANYGWRAYVTNELKWNT